MYVTQFWVLINKFHDALQKVMNHFNTNIRPESKVASL